MGELIDLRQRFAHIRNVDRQKRMKELEEGQRRIESIKLAFDKINAAMMPHLEDGKCTRQNTSRRENSDANVIPASE